MARVIDYAMHSARRGRGGSRGRDPVVGALAEALAYFGGEAHRRMVLDRLVAARPDGEDPELYRLKVIQTFEAHCDDNLSARERQGLFHRPFGRESHRWALNRAAAEVLRPAAAMEPAG